MAENLRRSPSTKQELLLSDIYNAIKAGGGGPAKATEATLLLVETNTAAVATALVSSRNNTCRK